MKYNKFINELFEFPLARDSRIRASWEQNGKGVHVTSMVGAHRVGLTWHERTCYPSVPARRPFGMKDRIEPRMPESSDMNILFRLLTMDSPIKVDSLHQLAVEIFDSGQAFYSVSVIDALRIWQRLSIRWPRRSLGPPITKVEPYGKRGLIIYISDEWIDACRGGVRTTKVPPLPLPMQATPQNMVLHTWWIGSRANIDINKFFYRVSGNKRGTKPTPHVPFTSWIVVERWYASIGGKVEHYRMPFALVPTKYSRVSKNSSKRQVSMREVTSKHFSMRVTYPKPKLQGYKQRWLDRRSQQAAKP